MKNATEVPPVKNNGESKPNINEEKQKKAQQAKQNMEKKQSYETNLTSLDLPQQTATSNFILKQESSLPMQEQVLPFSGQISEKPVSIIKN